MNDELWMVNGVGVGSLGVAAAENSPILAVGDPSSPWALYSATNPQSLKARIDCGYELGEDEAAFGLGAEGMVSSEL